MKIKLITAFFALTLTVAGARADNNTPPYKDPSQPIDVRVKDLLSRMTPDEKFWQVFMIPGDLSQGKERYKDGVFGLQTDAAAGDGATGQLLRYSNESNAYEMAKKVNEMQKYFVEETRLGIPIIVFHEALHGLCSRGAVVFPQSIAMAASWNPELMHEVSAAIAVETKARGLRDILSPVVNLANDPRWGRTEETYGECPFLSSKMGVAFVSEFEKIGVITTPKHFIANAGDGGRDSYPISFNERQIKEYYLPAFKACFEEGGSRSVMTAYNTLDGTMCSANDWLLRKVLKEEIGFRGFIITDACALGGSNDLHFTSTDYAGSAKIAMEGGLDVIFQGGYEHTPLFKRAFDEGWIDPKRLDDAVERVLRAKFELGLFEEPYIDADKAESLTNTPEHREIARRMARETFVLLKNNNNVLPLNNVKSIALIGRGTDAALLGGYAGPGANTVTILAGMKALLGNSVRINHAHGVPIDAPGGLGLTAEGYVNVPASAMSCKIGNSVKQGLKGEYYDNAFFTGKPVMTRVDESMEFGWALYSPDPAKIPFDNFSIVWTGKIKSPVSGKYNIGITANDGYRLYINGKLLVDNWRKVSFGTHTAPFDWEKGKEYDIKVEYFEPAGNARFQLVWNVGADDAKQDIADAVEAAKASDVAVITVGIREGEASDRAKLSLQGKQIEMINAVAATGKPIVVLVVGGSAVTMDGWMDKVDAIMDIWYPGDEGGHAVAEVLTGKYAPSGKLPLTFPLHEGQLPFVYNHKPTGRIDDYNNLSGQPLFPFGYGLSYTTFEYSDIKFDKKEIGVNGSTKVRCKVRNSGKAEGTEVVQLYMKDVIASVSQPVTQLKGFQKISLKPGEVKEVTFEITPEMLKLLNAEMNWVVEPGEFRFMIGASCKDIRLHGNINVTNVRER
ncbi:MAG: glycoside hydrolase family 3 C-terminal domain-containing protein [Bacteroidales bacterium]|jgi:beta-glucosidase|nr:glycoside hydrolase family 3 C-terminal domain-containing protein [Bacteroidales bacterium]